MCIDCIENYYNWNGNGICLPCPNGGICLGKDIILVAIGFWQDIGNITDQSLNKKPNIYPCDNGKTCCADLNGCSLKLQCKDGLTGPFCSICENPDYKVWNNKCVKCTSTNWGYMGFIFFVSLVLVIYLFFFTRGYNVFFSNFMFT